MAELIETELERRLTLYQTFLKLYEHHSSLLDDILQLEDLQITSLTKTKSFFFQGVINSTSVHAITNLCAGETQTLHQPQQIWTIGRSCHSGICLADSYVSRHHAAIQFVEQEQSFYLIDFNSTNGSYVNGEPVFRPVLLKDGSCIRLGNTSFHFFLSATSRVLPSVAVELLMQMIAHPNMDMQVKPSRTAAKTRILRENLDDTVEIPYGVSSQFQISCQESNSANVPLLNVELSEEILSYFSSH